jgi:hypothetical protein
VNKWYLVYGAGHKANRLELQFINALDSNPDDGDNILIGGGIFSRGEEVWGVLLLFSVVFCCFFSTPILTDLTGSDLTNSTTGVESPTYQQQTFNIPLCLLN